MNFNKAFDFIKAIYDQCDHHSCDQWNGFKPELKKAVEKYTNVEAYTGQFYCRTDISQDDVWELECLESGIAALFAMVHPLFITEEATTASTDKSQPSIPL